MNYSEKFKDPRWQKKRLEILNRDGFKCRYCDRDTETLHVHHIKNNYEAPWDVEGVQLITLCEDCHKWEHEQSKLLCKVWIDNISQYIPQLHLIALLEQIGYNLYFKNYDKLDSIILNFLNNKDDKGLITYAAANFAGISKEGYTNE